MCRHLAYLGPEITLGSLITQPEHSLIVQSYAPRLQRHGRMNADGFGVGWYVDGDPAPARHRGAGPVWADQTFADLGRVIRSRSFLAAVRSATAGMPVSAGAAAPFGHGPWLFSLNGALAGWPHEAAALVGLVPPERMLTLGTMSDSTLLWALALDRLERGVPAGEALADIVTSATKACGGRINLLLTDGSSITATTFGDTLSVLELPDGGVVVASEPYDDDPGWRPIADRSLVEVSASGIQISQL